MASAARPLAGGLGIRSLDDNSIEDDSQHFVNVVTS